MFCGFLLGGVERKPSARLVEYNVLIGWLSLIGIDKDWSLRKHVRALVGKVCPDGIG
jgi:hypothetical protein